MRDLSHDGEPRSGSLLSRLFSRHGAALLARNTVVSCLAFAVGLLLLWLLVNFAHTPKVVAGAMSFIAGNTLHYVLGREWIFRGTDRGVAAGYGLFLVNGAIGLALTTLLYAMFVHFTSVHYLVARVIVSLVAGLAIFLLNAVLNFQRL